MFYYDGFNFSEYLLVTDVGRPILPPQTIYDKQVMGRSGSYFFQKEHDPITIPIEVKIFEDHNMTYREMVRFLAGKLNKQEPKRLIFDDEPHMYIEGILHGSTDLENLIRAGQGVINFLCPDPFYYAIDDEIFIYNSEGDYLIRRTKGNTESLPLIEIKGTNTDGVISIKTDHAEINYDGPLNNGQTLVLDSSYITSYIKNADGSRVSANDDIDSMEFPYLIVGDNQIKVEATGNATITEIKIHANSRWN